MSNQPKDMRSPAWPHSAGYGYAPTGIVGLLVVVLLILVLTGRL